MNRHVDFPFTDAGMARLAAYRDAIRAGVYSDNLSDPDAQNRVFQGLLSAWRDSSPRNPHMPAESDAEAQAAGHSAFLGNIQ